MAERRDELLGILRRRGPSPAADLCRLLGISQPTLSRAVAGLRDELVMVGRARSTRYAARRTISGCEVPVPVFIVPQDGAEPRLLARLHPVEPSGFYVEGEPGGGSGLTEHLPWYLQDLRPGGFLGRLLARELRDEGFPWDPRFWSDDHLLRFASTHGSDLPGAFILGRASYRAFIDGKVPFAEPVSSDERTHIYPALAEKVLASGPAGSSAAGEQPKFLAARRDDSGATPVLVKFSPDSGSATALRVADLLVAEHQALKTLSERGVPTPASSLIRSERRTFLEVERFDRVGLTGRCGYVTLASLDGEFVGSDLQDWDASVAALADLGVVPVDVVSTVRWLSVFGRCIGNTDMHFGNLAFLLAGTRVTRLAPVYDMLPMHYYPRHETLPSVRHELPAIYPGSGVEHASAVAAALSYWQELSRSDAVSADFAALASQNVAALTEHARKWRVPIGRSRA